MPAPPSVDLSEHRRSYLLPDTVHSTIPRRPQPAEIGAHWVARGLLVETAAALHATPHRLTYREERLASGGHDDVVSITALLTLPGGGLPTPTVVALRYGHLASYGGDFWQLTVDGAVPAGGAGVHLPSPAALARIVRSHHDDIADPTRSRDRGAPQPPDARAGRTVRPPEHEGGDIVAAAAPAAGAVAVYSELPPHTEAHAAVASVINVALAAERGRQNLTTAFRLLPVAVEETSAAGRPYLALRWGVFVPDPDYAHLTGPYAELVSYGALRRRRDGQLRYDPRGLHEPLGAAELERLLTAAGERRHRTE